MPARPVLNNLNHKTPTPSGQKLARLIRDFKERQRQGLDDPESRQRYGEQLRNIINEFREIRYVKRRHLAVIRGITLPNNISDLTANHPDVTMITQGSGSCDDKGVDVCAICLEASKTRRQILNCGHGYHDTCIRSWLLRKDNCPLCRATVDFQ